MTYVPPWIILIASNVSVNEAVSRGQTDASAWTAPIRAVKIRYERADFSRKTPAYPAVQPWELGAFAHVDHTALACHLRTDCNCSGRGPHLVCGPPIGPVWPRNCRLDPFQYHSTCNQPGQQAVERVEPHGNAHLRRLPACGTSVPDRRAQQSVLSPPPGPGHHFCDRSEPHLDLDRGPPRLYPRPF